VACQLYKQKHLDVERMSAVFHLKDLSSDVRNNSSDCGKGIHYFSVNHPDSSIFQELQEIKKELLKHVEKMMKAENSLQELEPVHKKVQEPEPLLEKDQELVPH